MRIVADHPRMCLAQAGGCADNLIAVSNTMRFAGFVMTPLCLLLNVPRRCCDNQGGCLHPGAPGAGHCGALRSQGQCFLCAEGSDTGLTCRPLWAS